MKRRCLVVGANGGMGNAITGRLLQEGYQVIATYHVSKERLEIYKNNGNVKCLYLDLNNFNNEFLQNEELEGITDIVFAAGKESLKNISECTRNEMIEQYNVNIFSPLLIVQNVLKRYEEGMQNIIFISSSAAIELKPGNGAYALSKACLCNLVKMLDNELKMRGIRVNCIIPGWCETEMTERISVAKGSTVDIIKSSKLENKLVHVDEIAEICIFLLSNTARNIHGQFIGVDVPEKGI